MFSMGTQWKGGGGGETTDGIRAGGSKEGIQSVVRDPDRFAVNMPDLRKRKSTRSQVTRRKKRMHELERVFVIKNGREHKEGGECTQDVKHF